MSALLGPWFSCSFSALTFSQGRRVGSRSRWRLEPMLTTEWTTSGSRSLPCAPRPAAARPVPDRGRPRPRLVLTLTNGPEEEGQEERQLKQQEAASLHTPPCNLDYLRSIGHCIWISDLPHSFDVDAMSPRRTPQLTPPPPVCPTTAPRGPRPPSPPKAPRPRAWAPELGCHSSSLHGRGGGVGRVRGRRCSNALSLC